MRIKISKILHNSFAIAWGNSGIHNFSVNNDYQLIYIEKTLYNTKAQEIECPCKIQWYTILILSLSILGLVIFIILKSKKLQLFRGQLFSNAVKIMLFISDTQYYVPIKLCNMAGSIHLFKLQ